MRPSASLSVRLLSLASRRARVSVPLPRKVPPPPGSPVSEKNATGEAAAASPPPGVGREGARARGRRDVERGGGGARCTLGSGRTRACLAATGGVPLRVSSPPAPLTHEVYSLGPLLDEGPYSCRHSDLCLQDGKGEKEKTPTAPSLP